LLAVLYCSHPGHVPLGRLDQQGLYLHCGLAMGYAYAFRQSQASCILSMITCWCRSTSSACRNKLALRPLPRFPCRQAGTWSTCLNYYCLSIIAADFGDKQCPSLQCDCQDYIWGSSWLRRHFPSLCCLSVCFLQRMMLVCCSCCCFCTLPLHFHTSRLHLLPYLYHMLV